MLKSAAADWVFRAAPIVVILLLVGPVVAGLAFVIAQAFGLSPGIGAARLSLAPLVAATQLVGLDRSIWLSFWIGPASALAALGLVAFFTASFAGTRMFVALAELMRPALAVPHAAAALGFAFLVAPSGFLMRLVSPELTGFNQPPDWLIVNDQMGFAMFAGLVAKEVPFVFLVVLAALPQVNAGRARVAMSFGHGRVWAWLSTVFPGVYVQVRLPIYAVIAFASSVVDVAIILGPGTPPPLAVRVLQLMSDPDLDQRLVASATALIQIGVTIAAIVTWWLLERGLLLAGRAFVRRGFRFRPDLLVRVLAAAGSILSLFAVIGGIGILGVWSLGTQWRFPDALPAGWTLTVWQGQLTTIWPLVVRTAVIAFVSSLLAGLLVVACLENEYRRTLTLTSGALVILYLPLLVPQIAFLGGFSTLLLWLRADGNLGAVIFAHLIFVLPYVYLALADPWSSFDTRYLAVAQGLGKSPGQVLLMIRLPMLTGALLTAFAIGFAVSVAQYLPTLLIGAGRLPTITTEAVALASGGNRRLIGVYGLLQAVLPFIVLLIAGVVPAVLWRNRRAMRPGSAH